MRNTLDFKLGSEVYSKKNEELLERMRDLGIDGICLFNPAYISNLTGFSFISTERPMAYILDNEKSTFVVPRLEKEHLELGDYYYDDLIVYPEYPGKKRPMKFVKEELDRRGIDKLGVDQDGYSSAAGYFGPSLSELIDSEVVNVRMELEKFVSVKYDEELDLLRESAKWENLGLELLMEETESGVSEIDAMLRASKRASEAMVDTLGQKFMQTGFGSLPVYAFYRGQVGEGSALPHALASNEMINEGDVLGASASSTVGRFLSELERTWIVGEPSEEQRKFFNYAVEAQEIALNEIKPGKNVKDVDKAVRDYFESEDLWDYWRHHTGHTLGTRFHEPPFFDIGDDWEIKENMVFSVEPGLYKNDLGGFRHSDTVIVTSNGIERITYFPREIEDSIIR